MPFARGEISRTMHGEIKMHAERKEDGIWRSCRAARVRARAFDG